MLYLSVYPCLIAGILMLVRKRNPGRDRESLIDSLIVAIGIGVISWVFLMVPTAADSESTLLQKVTSMGYPFMDLVLLTVVVRLVIGGGRRGVSFYLLPMAALSLFLTDFFYSYISVTGQVYDSPATSSSAGGCSTCSGAPRRSTSRSATCRRAFQKASCGSRAVASCSSASRR